MLASKKPARQRTQAVRQTVFLFDRYIGAREQGRGHIEAERLNGLEVDHRFVLCRRLHRQVGGLLALEDAIDVTGCLPELGDVIRPVREQAAVGDEPAAGAAPPT